MHGSTTKEHIPVIIILLGGWLHASVVYVALV